MGGGGGMLVRCPNMCSGTRSVARLAPHFMYYTYVAYETGLIIDGLRLLPVHIEWTGYVMKMPIDCVNVM